MNNPRHPEKQTQNNVNNQIFTSAGLQKKQLLVEVKAMQ